MKKILLSTGFTLFASLLSTPAAAVSFSNIYTFSESLSSPGNIFNVTTAFNQLPPELIPPGIDIPPVIPFVPPYDADGRFSNGLVWVDYLAEDLGITLTPSTELSVLFPGSDVLSPLAFDPNTGAPIISPFFNGATATTSVNFAYGGAQSGFIGDSGIPGLLAQVGWFSNDLTQSGQTADPNALYIVWSGPNDYQTVPDPNPEETVGNIAAAIQTLYDLGARNLLVPNLPDLGETPRANSPFAPIPSEPLSQVTQIHNALLATTLNNLSGSNSDLNIIPLDVFSLFDRTLNNPEEFGFTNVTDPCLSPDPSLFPNLAVPDPTTLMICDNPEEYEFWDGIHPTTATHAILGEFALETLQQAQPVPEPRVSVPFGLLMLLGWISRNKSESFRSKATHGSDDAKINARQ